MQGATSSSLPSALLRAAATSSRVVVSSTSLISTTFVVTRVRTSARAPTAWSSAFLKAGISPPLLEDEEYLFLPRPPHREDFQSCLCGVYLCFHIRMASLDLAVGRRFGAFLCSPRPGLPPDGPVFLTVFSLFSLSTFLFSLFFFLLSANCQSPSFSGGWLLVASA